MINLIRNELYKTFHKKTIFVFALLILAMSILNSWIYKTSYDDEGLYKQNYNNIEINEIELNNYNLNNPEELQDYIDLKTSYDIEKLIKNNNYDSNSWQYQYVYSSDIYNIVYNINIYTYLDKDDEEKEIYTNKLNKILDKLNEDNWKYFINEELNSSGNDQLKKEILKYRLNNNVPYNNSYLNDAITGYENETRELEKYKDYNKLTYEEKLYYQSLLKEQQTNKYIMDTKQNVNKPNNISNRVATVVNNYEIFIIIFIILISSSIVSTEYKDGTIKQLLIKPYKRTTILLSKYITCIIFLLLVVLYTTFIEFLVSGIFLGFNELNIPLLIYNYKINQLKELNCISYMLLMFACRLPEFILLLTLSFSLSTIFASTSLANTLTILGYMGKDILNTLSRTFNLQFMNYFVTLNWDLREYLGGKLPITEGLTLKHSIIICLIYLTIMLSIIFTLFKKKI